MNSFQPFNILEKVLKIQHQVSFLGWLVFFLIFPVQNLKFKVRETKTKIIIFDK